MAKNDLKHYGILGMHWGVRRRTPGHPDYEKAHTLKKKSVRELSNDEIKMINNRLQLERQLKDLKAADNQRGQSFVMRLLSGKFAKGLATEIIKEYVVPGMQEAFTGTRPHKKKPGTTYVDAKFVS
jgi:hypothetical protein